MSTTPYKYLSCYKPQALTAVSAHQDRRRGHLRTRAGIVRLLHSFSVMLWCLKDDCWLFKVSWAEDRSQRDPGQVDAKWRRPGRACRTRVHVTNRYESQIDVHFFERSNKPVSHFHLALLHILRMLYRLGLSMSEPRIRLSIIYRYTV